MSRFLDQVRHAETQRPRPRSVSERAGRPFRVLTVANNKGGVGKTTIATNLAVYLRAVREDLPVLILGFDERSILDRMFALDLSSPEETVASALRVGAFTSAARLGQYGVHYVPSSSDISELKREIVGPYQLEAALDRTNWRGIVIVDTRSDFEILTRNAIAASDLTMVVVKDGASLAEAQRVFDQLTEWNQPRERARILLSLIDLRVKYQNGEKRDILAFLLSQIRRRGYPLFGGFISRSPKVEALYANPEGRAVPILHGATNSIVHRQMHHLADDVLAVLDVPQSRADGGEPSSTSAVNGGTPLLGRFGPPALR